MKQAKIDPEIFNLPVQPVIASAINAEASSQDFTSKSLGRIISRDPALTTKVLKLANSSYYGLSRQIDTIERAVIVLGVNTIKNLATSLSLASLFQPRSTINTFNNKGLWLHSLGCAVAAKNLLALTRPDLADTGFLCGIMHDIGKIALFQQLTPRMLEVMREMQATGKRQFEAEAAILGFSHPEVGALLAEKWLFPPGYIAAIRGHHEAKIPVPVDNNRTEILLTAATRAANKIAKVLKLGASTDPALPLITPEILEALKINPKNLPALLKTVKDEYQSIVDTLSE